MSQPPFHPVGTLYEIRWKEVCPWLILVKALRVTLLVRVLVLALAGLLLTQWGWAWIDQIFFVDAGPVIEMSDRQRELSDNSLALIKVVESHKIGREALLSTRESGTFYHGWYWLAEPFICVVDRELTLKSMLGFFLCGLWGIVVWAVFGGAIARIAAVYLTRGETLGPLTALHAAVSKWPSTVGSPLIVLLSVIAMAVPLVLLGLTLQFNFAAVLAGLLWVIVLAWGLMLAVVLIGFGFGWPLMWACIGVEQSDAFDGVSRCYAYVYQRPLHLAFYVVVASLLGFFGDAVVAVFTSAAVTLAKWVLSFGMSGEQTAEMFSKQVATTDAPFATRAISSWTWAFMLILKSYPFACLWAMSVGIYLLLRQHVDATELDEITFDDGEQRESLSALKAKESAMPEVDRPSSAATESMQED